MYHQLMRVLLIHGNRDVPPPLRELIARGSTELHERRLADPVDSPGSTPDIDRVVFWGASDDSALLAATRPYLNLPPAARGDRIVFVSPEAESAPAPGLAPNEHFVWPRDEDRLKMAFMTGA
jgi:hypothetical protein